MFGSGKARQGRGAGARKRPRATTYKLTPTNYDILSEQEKADVLASFARIVGAAEKRLDMRIINKRAEVAAAGHQHQYMDHAVYLTSKFDLGKLLMGSGFQFVRTESPPSWEIRRENLRSMEMESGAWWRAYTVYNFPRSIRPAWVMRLSEICSIVNVSMTPISDGRARSFLVGHANTLEAKIGGRHKVEAAEARRVNDMMHNQETSLLECGVTAVVTHRDRKSLREECREFERQARQRQISCMAVAGKQRDTLAGWGKRFAFPLQSTAAFFPFSSSDMMEPNGVYLGDNQITGAPVIYDYSRRANYNMIILGQSGYGKSMTVKTYVDNFFQMIRTRYGEDHRVMAYILDLHGEYVRLSDYLGMGVVDMMTRDEMGLDPFKVSANADQAAGILCDVVEMPPNLRSLTLARSAGAGSTAELVDRLRTDGGDDADDCRKAATYLAQFVDGGLARMFAGKMDVGDMTTIAMRKASKDRVTAMLITLILMKIWQDMRDAPEHVPKLLVIEEAWFMLRMESTAAVLNDIVKSGRKENVHMLVMTQELDDVMTNVHGKGIINNSSTKVLLRMLPETAALLKKILKLSQKEADEITTLHKGQAIMRSDNNRIKVSIMPTEKQLKTFDTAAPDL